MSTAEDIVTAVGGADNIVSLSHCATRLRFQLVDASGIDTPTVESIKGVMGAVPQAGERYQIIMGGAVQNAFNEINALPEMTSKKPLSDEELKARHGQWQPRPSTATSGYLWKYAQGVGPAVSGAVTHPGGAHELKSYADL